MAVTPAGAPAAEEQHAGDRPRLMLIVNPTATTVTTRRGEQIERVLAGAYDVDTRLTDHPGHATELAAEAVAAGAAVVAVYAGDGTTNEAIRALAGTQTALAHLPGGNASVLARMLGMGADGVKAAERVASLVHAEPQAIDLGYVNGRPFSFTAGIGLDAAVVKLVDADQARKHRFRWGAFWMEAVRLARSEYFVKEPMHPPPPPSRQPTSAPATSPLATAPHSRAARSPPAPCSPASASATCRRSPPAPSARSKPRATPTSSPSPPPPKSASPPNARCQSSSTATTGATSPKPPSPCAPAPCASSASARTDPRSSTRRDET